MNENIKRNLNGYATAIIFAVLVALSFCSSVRSEDIESKINLGKVAEKIEKGGAIAGAAVEATGVVADEVESQTGKEFISDEQAEKAVDTCEKIESVAGGLKEIIKPYESDSESVRLVGSIIAALMIVVVAFKSYFLKRLNSKPDEKINK
jgi:hypothetical protein